MADAATLIEDLSSLLPPLSANSIVSRTFLTRDGFKAILFGFAPGQELSEHTAAVPAVLHFLRGKAAVTLGDREGAAGPGTWAHLPAHLPHSIRAEDEVVMLLLLLG
jgi:quercetin dioxygenase-like cupin family protein